MTDTKILLEHLQEYSKQLSAHLLVLEERHETLGAAWAALREVYEGTGAEVFAEAFEAASGRLRDYSTAGADFPAARQRGRKTARHRRGQPGSVKCSPATC